MIHLKRDRLGIASGLTGKTRLKRELVLLRGKHSGELERLGAKFWTRKSHWKAGKSKLRADSHEKCAYCEAPTAVVAHGDVDHFRPKSVYWWLAYCYDNHLYSCQICNETYKVDNFPVPDKRLPRPAVSHKLTDAQLKALAGTLAPDPIDASAVKAFHALVSSEKADLPNPYDTDPEPYFKWLADDVLKEVEIRPRSNSPDCKRVFDAVDQYYGLNREELRRARWSLAYKHLVARKQDLDDFAGHTKWAKKHAKTAAEIKEMLADNAPFAGMARYFVRVKWKLKL
jgi:hypothetical protein